MGQVLRGRGGVAHLEFHVRLPRRNPDVAHEHIVQGKVLRGRGTPGSIGGVALHRQLKWAASGSWLEVNAPAAVSYTHLFPYGTFVINLTACIVIGFTLTYLGKRADLNPAWRFFVPIGFIGAYSTFSTYEWETLSTLRSGAFALAALYAVGSLIAGLAATWLGATLAEVLS